MKKIFNIVLSLIILVSILIPSISVKASDEDFTTFIEVDPGTDITKSSNIVSVSTIFSNSISYVYKDYGINYFTGNQEWYYSVYSGNASASTANGIVNNIWALSNFIGSYYPNRTGVNSEIAIQRLRVASGVTNQFQLQVIRGDGTYGSGGGVTVSDNTYYYLKTLYNSASGNMSLYVYSDILHTSLVGSIVNWSTGLTGATFRYVYAFQTDGYSGYNDDTWSGQILSFSTTYTSPYIAPSVTTNNAIITSYGAALYGTLNSLGGAPSDVNVTMNIGTISGVWQENLGIQPTLISTNNTQFVKGATGLQPDTTYYYQAVAYYYVDLYTRSIGYGSIESFNTGNATIPVLKPSVQTGSAIYNSITDTYTLYGSTLFSVLPIIERGFGVGFYGDTFPTENITSGAGNFGIAGQWNMSIDNPSSSVPLLYMYQAWAKDSAGNIGYGSILNLTTSATLGGAEVSMVSANSANNTSIVAVGSLDKVGSVTLSLYGFAYSPTNNVSSAEQKWQAQPYLTQGQYQMQIDSLNPLTNYYVWFGVSDAYLHWVWSTPLQVTTGAESGITLLAPIVITNTPTSVTANSVNASLSITALAGGLGFTIVQIDSYGFDVGIKTGEYSDLLRQAGSFNIGNYWMQISSALWENGDVIYLRAYAHNTLGKEAWGKEIAVVLKTTGEVTVLPAPTTPVVGDFSLAMKGWLRSLGMDNPTGHWAALLLLEMIFAFVFGVLLITLRKDEYELERKAVSVIWLIVALVIFGGFVFSGLLGMWAVLILIIVAVGFIFYLVSPLFSGGRAGE